MADAQVEFETFISNVEKVNGVPLVVSPYGFKKIEIEGKTYLAPMDLQEANAVMAELGQPALTVPSCGKDQMQNCYRSRDCNRCEASGTSAGTICICVE